MQFAINTDDEQRIEALPKARAICPSCRRAVLAKCGKINVHHWAHINADCDHWSEPEGKWHRDWKELVPPEQREVVIGNHRADIVHANGSVIELQHSPISPETIAEREAHYGNMMWIFSRSGSFEFEPEVFTYKYYWRRARKSAKFCRCPVYIDLGEELFCVNTMGPEPPNVGKGNFIAKEIFVSWLKGGDVNLRSSLAHYTVGRILTATVEAKKKKQFATVIQTLYHLHRTDIIKFLHCPFSPKDKPHDLRLTPPRHWFLNEEPRLSCCGTSWRALVTYVANLEGRERQRQDLTKAAIEERKTT